LEEGADRRRLVAPPLRRRTDSRERSAVVLETRQIKVIDEQRYRLGLPNLFDVELPLSDLLARLDARHLTTTVA
ncbi:MAG: hypothetical protein ACREQQ_16370, partial [Candidatus Binatia bacterium]